MKNICDVDENFAIKTSIEKDDIKFFDVRENPFKIHGVFYENGKFRRMPECAAREVSEGVFALHANTAGGRVRFKTDSPYVAIHAEMSAMGKMPHFALTGSAGFDLYIRDEKERYFKSFIPPFNITDGYESIVEFESSDMREITINFPLYSEVKRLFVGVSEKSVLSSPTPYNREKPIVFYGSSITQGGCASRPGLSYESILSRAFDTDYINLGFSGNAKAEERMAEHIKNLDMSVFVYDYDHNAPTMQHLAETHEKFFLAVRSAHPDLPVIMMSRPKFILTEEEEERLGVINTTYENAKKRGDKNVYLIDGKTLMALAENEGTVDDCHPNDLGFMSMAKALEKVLMEIL